MSLRVEVVVSHLVPTLGMEKAALGVIRELSERFDVTVVSLAGGADDRRVWPDVVVANRRPLRGWRRLSTLLRAPSLLRGPDADVRLFVGAPAAAASLLTTRARPTDIVWEHSIGPARLASSRALRLVWAVLRRRYGRVGAVVAVSPPVARVMERSGARVVTIPNIVSSMERTGSAASRRLTSPARLLCVGTLSALKNQRVAIEALLRLPTDVTLTIVGDGPERGNLEALVARLEVGGRVEFTGHLDGPEVEALMRDSALLVHPARSETFGLVYLEAAALGLPVVSLEHDVAQWLIPRYVPGTVVPEAGFAGAVSSLLCERPAAEAVSRAEAARLGDLAPDVLTDRWVQLVHEVVRRHD
ncbi:MAG: glycosyltransferase [Cellulomonadaceae bacterium]